MSERCAKPGCTAEPTMREDVRSSWSSHHDPVERTYLLCQPHDAEYFLSGSGFLDKARSERIKRDLVAAGGVEKEGR